MKKQTAVEWLVEQLDKNFDYVVETIIEKAKAMEREQIIDAANWDSKSQAENGYSKGHEYYTQTYEE